MEALHQFKRTAPVEALQRYSGDGPYLYIDGKKYFDCCSGTFNLSLGYNAKPVIAAIKEQLDRCAHLSSEFTNDITNELLVRFRNHLPHNMNSMWFRDLTGSTANECAVRIAQKYTGRSEVISLFLSHHGQSITSTSISGNSFRRQNFGHSDFGMKIPAPDCNNCFYKQHINTCDILCAERLTDFIDYASSGNVAALIVEPIMGNAGNIVPPQSYYARIRRICDEHNILIIADEIQTGFGRTGTFFASTGYAKSLRPDIITFAKGAGGVGIPVAGVIMKDRLNILEKWEHSFTSGANPIAIIALWETIKYIEEYNVLDNVNRQSTRLMKGLRDLKETFRFISNIRGKGLMLGFDMPNVETAKRFIAIAKEQQLILRPNRYGFGRTIKVRPPLIISEAQVHEIIEKLEVSLMRLTSETEIESVEV